MRNLLKISTLALILLPFAGHSMDRRGRLGVGYTNQLKNDVPALSFKLQKSRSFAFSGIFGINTKDNGGYGAGIKAYKNLFDEPQLTFYTALLGAIINQKVSLGEDESGFQFDLTMGSEFSFTGLQSLGFSVEFGVSANKVGDFAFETVGDSFVVAAAHFYL